MHQRIARSTGARGHCHSRAGAILSLGILAAPIAAAEDAVLLHRWPADGDASDLVGAADGSAIGDVAFEPGRFGLAFRFAHGGAVTLPSPAGEGINGDFTISLWCRFESATPAAILHKGAVCGRGEWYRMESRTDGDLQCSVSDDETGQVALLTREADLHNGEWHHVAWRREGNAQSILVDGCLLVSPTSSEVGHLAIAHELTLGGPWCSADGTRQVPFSGWLDEVRWYAGALGDASIRELARGPLVADLTDDDWVDAADLGHVLGTWGVCGVCCAADLDGSGEVDAADLAMLLDAWSVE